MVGTSLSELVTFMSGPDVNSLVGPCNRCGEKCVQILRHPEMCGERIKLGKLDNPGNKMQKKGEASPLGYFMEGEPMGLPAGLDCVVFKCT